MKTHQFGDAGNIKGGCAVQRINTFLCKGPGTAAAGRWHSGELAAWSIVVTKLGGGGATNISQVPSDLTGSKQHLTFPTLKEYDSRKADRGEQERGKEGEQEARDKSLTKCRLPPKQLVCNQCQSSFLSGQFDFHFSNEAFIFGLITGQAKLKLAARQSTDNSRLRRRSCEQPFLLLSFSPHPHSTVEEEKEGNEGGMEREKG